MAYKPEMDYTNPTNPDCDVLYYLVEDSGTGDKVYAQVLSWREDRAGNLRRAWVNHPNFGNEEMNGQEGRLAKATPVRAVLREKYDADVGELRSKVASLQEALDLVLADHAEVKALLTSLREAKAKASAPVRGVSAPA